MIIHVNSKTLFHYFMIYVLYMINDSFLYKLFLSQYNLLIFGIAFIFIVLKKEMQYKYVLIFAGVLAIFVIFTRLFSGGVGIEALLGYMVPILCVVCVLLYDKENALHRWVNIVTFMAVISILSFIICQSNPEILRNLFPSHYTTGKTVSEWLNSTQARYSTSYSDGLFLYSVRHMDVDRNNGVFSEPGLHQMVLSITLFMVLFIRDYKIKQKNLYAVISVLVIALITTRSTSGYISLLAILLVYIFSHKRLESYKTIKFVILLIGIGASYLIYDLLNNGINSTLYKTVLNKLFTNNSFDLSADTGAYRLMTIQTCWQSMLHYPLGIGFDSVRLLMAEGSTGAQLFIFGAAMGIVPFITIQMWQLYPAVKTTKISLAMKILYIFIFYNSALTQSKEFYSAMIIIPLYFYFNRNNFEIIEELELRECRIGAK